MFFFLLDRTGMLSRHPRRLSNQFAGFIFETGGHWPLTSIFLALLRRGRQAGLPLPLPPYTAANVNGDRPFFMKKCVIKRIRKIYSYTNFKSLKVTTYENQKTVRFPTHLKEES